MTSAAILNLEQL